MFPLITLLRRARRPSIHPQIHRAVYLRRSNHKSDPVSGEFVVPEEDDKADRESDDGKQMGEDEREKKKKVPSGCGRRDAKASKTQRAHQDRGTEPTAAKGVPPHFLRKAPKGSNLFTHENLQREVYFWHFEIVIDICVLFASRVSNVRSSPYRLHSPGEALLSCG